MLLCVFGLGWIFLHVFADLSIPLFPQITCLIFYGLNFCAFFQNLVFKKIKGKKEKGEKPHPNLSKDPKPTNQKTPPTPITTLRYSFL